MKNNLEEKAKFFAQYWGQEIAKYPYYDEATYHKSNPTDALEENNVYLELTPLSQISDDDAEYLDQLLANSFDEYGCYYGMGSRHYWQPDEVDYLRSKGYALPYLDYSVEDLLEKGWAKFKNNE